MPKNLDKLLFIIVNAAVILVVTFVAGVQSGATKNAGYQIVHEANRALDLFWVETVKGGISGDPVNFLQAARRPGSGVTVNLRQDDDGLILLSGFMDGGNQLRLIRRDGAVVARWPVRFSEHFPDPSHLPEPPHTDWNVDLHGALALPDGSVVFNYEYGGTVKLSRCGDVVWKVAHPTHHSIETSENGGFWVPGRSLIPVTRPEDYHPFMGLVRTDRFEDDLILKLSDDGRIVQRKSVAEILTRNGFEALLTATGYNLKSDMFVDDELVHLNKIGELPATYAAAFPQFEAGDLILSLRNYNMIFVVDPDDWRVKWHRTGPYLRQHDPEFNADGTITVFNNNAYFVDFEAQNVRRRESRPLSDITRVNPATGAADVAYDARAETAFFSLIRGKQDPLPGGGFLVTEFEAGRVFEVDGDGGLVWEYINRYDESRVLEITEARRYPADYFTVDDWSCP